MALVEDGQDNGKGQESSNGYQNALGSVADGGIFDLWLAVDDGKVRLGAAHNEEDNGKEHQKLNELLVLGSDEDAAFALDGLENAAEKTKSKHDERCQTNAFECHPTNVEIDVVWGGNCCQAKTGADDTGEGEDDEGSEAGVFGEAMLETEEYASC